MVRKETCTVCKGNKFVEIVRKLDTKDWRRCHGCNGTGYQVRVTLPDASGRY